MDSPANVHPPTAVISLPHIGEPSSVVSKAHSTEIEQRIKLRRFVAFVLLGTITFNTLVTLTAVYLVGFGLMTLSDKVILILLAQTVAQIAATFLTVVKNLFPTKD